VNQAREFHPAANPFFTEALSGGGSTRPSHDFRHSPYATDEEFHRPPLKQGKRSVYGHRFPSRDFLTTVLAVVETDSTSGLDCRDWLGAAGTDHTSDRIRFAIFQVNEFEKSGQGKIAARMILRFVEKNFAARDLIAISTFLRAMDAATLSPWSIVAVLRSTFRARHIMPGWKAFLDQARDVLAARHEPVEKILYGLG